MTKIASLLTLLLMVLVCLLPAAPAMAQRDRVFVASYGSDSNPCTFGSPCKTFQQAIDVVAVGGEVTAIDSAGFGTFTISHAVTITSPNGVEAGVAAPASFNAAITINAGTNDIISLNGLTLDGDNVSESDGIRFNSGASLNIQNSVIRNFGNNGITFVPSVSSQLSMSTTLVSNNSNYGIYLVPTGSEPVVGVLDHVDIESNFGVGLEVTSTTQTVNVTVSDSVIAKNGMDGIDAFWAGGALNVMVRSSTIANNGGNGGGDGGSLNNGLSVEGSGAQMWITRSTITGNVIGWSTSSSGALITFSDNNIVGNGSVNTAPTSTATYE